MIKVEDPTGQFGVLFVDTWKQTRDETTGALRSESDDWSADADLVPAQGRTPAEAVQNVDASHGDGVQGYERLAIQEGDVHGLPAASVVYVYESGSNPVTGKPLRFIASEVFISGGPSDQLGHLVFRAPYAFYGDASEIFDNILAGFTWR